MALAMAAAIAGSAVIGGIANYMGAKEAARAQEDANKISAQQRQKIEALVDEMQLPEFNRKLDKDEIKLLTQVVPDLPRYIAEQAPEALPMIASEQPVFLEHIVEKEPLVAKFIAEQAPELIQAKGEGAQAGMEAQRAALQALRRAGTEGDIISESEMIRARESAARAEAGQRGAITEEMARRGQLGGGRELLMKLAGQQASQQQAAEMGMSSAEDAIRRRLEALRGGAQLGGQMYAQDVARERSNVDIINQFNQRNTQAARLIERDAVAAENARRAREAQAQRGVQASNVEAQRQRQREDTSYARQQAQRGWEAGEAYKQRQTGYERGREQDLFQAKQAERTMQRDLELAERAREDDLAQQQFSNETQLLNIKAGQAAQASQAAQQQAAAAGQAARDRAQFFGDLAQTGVSAYGAYQAGEMSALDEELKREQLKRMRGY